jgi:hypothetical protein
MKSLNQIVAATTLKTAQETTGNITVWDNLINLSKFAGSSASERADAITIIKNALAEYEMRDWHKEVLNGVIKILQIEPEL